VFHQIPLSTFTLRQASRRSWRIGQSEPVRVFYMAYEGTLQSKLLSLMASKITASSALEGSFSEGEYHDPIPLADEDVRQFEVSLPSLVNALRRGGGIRGKGYENADGIIPLGTVDSASRGTVDTYLSLPNADEQELMGRCRQIRPRAGTSLVVVFTPTAVSLSPEARRALDGLEVAVAALESVLQPDTLAVNWDAVWDGSTAGTLELKPDELPSDPGEYLFDLDKMGLFCRGSPVRLSRSAKKLIWQLAYEKGKLLPMHTEVAGVRASTCRRELGRDVGGKVAKCLVITERGQGYRLNCGQGKVRIKGDSEVGLVFGHEDR
jgi:hypothetical protein